jgi:hypothetical protein
VYSQPSGYPSEGGYIYLSYVGSNIAAYKFTTGNRLPSFSLAGTSENRFGLGVSSPQVTSLVGATGSGIVWAMDSQSGSIYAFNAVPQGGSLTQIWMVGVHLVVLYYSKRLSFFPG